MAENRVTQQVLETLVDRSDATPSALASQQVLEVLVNPTPATVLNAIVSQQVLEVLVNTPNAWGTLNPIVSLENSPVAGTLWSLPTYFLANWREDVEVLESYQTDITQAESADEQRFGLLDKPVRVVRYRIDAFSQDSSARLEEVLNRIGTTSFLSPLPRERTELTVAANAGDLSLTCDLSNRLFNNLMRVLVLTPTPLNPSEGTFEIANVATTTSTGLTLISALQSSWPIGTLIFPLIECRLSLQTKAEGITNYIRGVPLEVQEICGPAALASRAGVGSWPADMSSENGIPIFDFKIDESDTIPTGKLRPGKDTDRGLVSVPVTWGTRPIFSGNIPLKLTTRASAIRYCAFFDGRVGRLLPFYLPLTFSPYRVISLSNSTLIIAAVGSNQDWANRPYLYVKNVNGTIEVRTITAFSRSGNQDTLTLSRALDSSWNTTIDACGPCLLARFDTDTNDQKWSTDGTLTTNPQFIELSSEQNITLANLAIVSPSNPLPARWHVRQAVSLVTQQVLEVLVVVSLANPAYVSQQVLEVLVNTA